tara:strand:+ start:722 stop:1762 length:1041 start_codon:yes stop_codon:yes gene_type:complete
MAYTTITDPSAYFQTVLYSGDGGGSNAITNTGNSNLQPDFVWVKERTSTSSHALTNSTNGAGYILSSNNADAQASANAFSSFNSDGFTVGSDGKTNESGQTYVGWQWKANGGTTASNSSGTITSTVQANTTAGFSIVTYTGNGSSGATVGHGLGKVPEMIFFKKTDSSKHWTVYNKTMNYSNEMYLDLDQAETSSNFFIADPTTSVFSISNNAYVNNNGSSYIAYCFTSIQGYSHIGKYRGNGNADGPFTYCGFKPGWIMIKKTSGVANWMLYDSTRNPYNTVVNRLLVNTNGTENTGSGDDIDFTSNGWKVRANPAALNENTGEFIYMAFAEHPFVASDVATTAR